MRKSDTEKRKLKISLSNIEDAIASFLIATSVVNRNEDIIEINLPIKAKDGIVEAELTVLTLSERN